MRMQPISEAGHIEQDPRRAAEGPADLKSESDLRRAIWLRENQEAIAAYNEFVAQLGVWSDGLRSF